MKRCKIHGFTLIETMIVLSVFAVLAIMVTSIILYSLRGTGKSSNTYAIRSEMDYTVEIITRQLRNAKSITTTCDGSAVLNRIDYTDANGNATFFECNTDYIASGSARLSSSKINITGCNFVCSKSEEIGVPESVRFNLSGKAKDAVGAEGADVDIETNILLRNY